MSGLRESWIKWPKKRGRLIFLGETHAFHMLFWDWNRIDQLYAYWKQLLWPSILPRVLLRTTYGDFWTSNTNHNLPSCFSPSCLVAWCCSSLQFDIPSEDIDPLWPQKTCQIATPCLTGKSLGVRVLWSKLWVHFRRCMVLSRLQVLCYM